MSASERVVPRLVTTNARAQRKLAAGMRALARVVAVTLGPSGRYVLLEHRSHLAPVFTKDGIEVARAMVVADREEEMGLRLLRNAALDVSASVGDGTTTTIVITGALARRCLTFASVRIDACAARAGLAQAGAAVMAELAAMARPAGLEDLKAVARTAANGDANLAALLAEAYVHVGAGGTIDIEMGNTGEDVLDLKTGHEFESQTLMRELLPPTGARHLKNPLIMFHDGELEHFEKMVPALEIACQEKRPLLILADDVSDEVRLGLLTNQRNGTVDIVVAKPPMYGDTRVECLSDLTVLCGGTAFVTGSFTDLRALDRRDLGGCDEAIITAEKMTLLGAQGDPAALRDRMALLRAELERGDSGTSPSGQADYSDKRQDRLKILSNFRAILHVGGANDSVIKSRFPLAENARRALFAAAESGILPGGGVAMLRAAQRAREKLVIDDADGRIGSQALFSALEQPLRWIVWNAGFRSDEVIARVLMEDDAFFGLDVATRQYCDLGVAGVVDSFQMVRAIIAISVSIAGSLLATSILISKAEDRVQPEKFRGTETLYQELMADGAFD
ncbi:MAG: chaperonin GroEL [Acidiphilium sp.]|nr:chaperonin GroEL [Acidiphilium sp.]MDD4936410.1 chaperonin GroEL [Acidiphilium sp.]